MSSDAPSPSIPAPVAPTDRLPMAVIGCGRMGRLHARVYAQLPSTRLVGVYDADPAAAAATAREYGTRAVADLDELLGGQQVRAVTIATPTTTHLSLAERCIQRGVACLIEKPLAKDAAEARRIADLARRHGVTVQVGHIERFNPAVRAMARVGVRPRFIEVDRISPLTFRSIDVGVVLDMMIHDIDIVLTLAASPVARVDAVAIAVVGDAEDICNAWVTFENGCVAHLNASRLAMKTERKLRVFGPDTYVSVDYQKKSGTVIRKGRDLAAIRAAVAALRRGEVRDLSDLNKDNLVEVEQLPVDDVEPIRAELEAFVHAVATGTRPVVSAEDGLAAVETAERIVAAARAAGV